MSWTYCSTGFFCINYIFFVVWSIFMQILDLMRFVSVTHIFLIMPYKHTTLWSNTTWTAVIKKRGGLKKAWAADEQCFGGKKCGREENRLFQVNILNKHLCQFEEFRQMTDCSLCTSLGPEGKASRPHMKICLKPVLYGFGFLLESFSC